MEKRGEERSGSESGRVQVEAGGASASSWEERKNRGSARTVITDEEGTC